MLGILNIVAFYKLLVCVIYLYLCLSPNDILLLLAIYFKLFLFNKIQNVRKALENFIFRNPIAMVGDCFMLTCITFASKTFQFGINVFI